LAVYTRYGDGDGHYDTTIDIDIDGIQKHHPRLAEVGSWGIGGRRLLR